MHVHTTSTVSAVCSHAYTHVDLVYMRVRTLCHALFERTRSLPTHTHTRANTHTHTYKLMSAHVVFPHTHTHANTHTHTHT